MPPARVADSLSPPARWSCGNMTTARWSFSILFQRVPVRYTVCFMTSNFITYKPPILKCSCTCWLGDNKKRGVCKASIPIMHANITFNISLLFRLRHSMLGEVERQIISGLEWIAIVIVIILISKKNPNIIIRQHARMH